MNLNLPNEHRFLSENVFDDCVNPEISIRSTGMFHQDREFVIRHFVDGKLVTEYTPLKEVDGWPLPGNDGLYDNHYYHFGQSENYLREYYEKLNKEQSPAVSDTTGGDSSNAAGSQNVLKSEAD